MREHLQITLFVCLLLLGVGLLGGLLVWRRVVRSETGIVLLGGAGIISSDQLIRNLSSKDVNVVRESLGVLNDRADQSGVTAALPLLQSKDDYVWLNAAIYVGNRGRSEAVPYLIKGLRHTAQRAQPEMVLALQKLTNQKMAADFDAWQRWWIANNPGGSFDFESHLGPFPVIAVTQPAAKTTP